MIQQITLKTNKNIERWAVCAQSALCLPTPVFSNISAPIAAHIIHLISGIESFSNTIYNCTFPQTQFQILLLLFVVWALFYLRRRNWQVSPVFATWHFFRLYHRAHRWQGHLGKEHVAMQRPLLLAFQAQNLLCYVKLKASQSTHSGDRNFKEHSHVHQE